MIWCIINYEKRKENILAYMTLTILSDLTTTLLFQMENLYIITFSDCL